MFIPKASIFRGSIKLPTSPEIAFKLFSPEGERLWVPDWNPELIYPQGVEWAESQVFRTVEDSGDAIWVVSKLEPEECYVIYFRIEPTIYVAKVDVKVKPTSVEGSEVSVLYTFIGLSEKGNDEISLMTSSSFETKMERWFTWLNQYLAKKG